VVRAVAKSLREDGAEASRFLTLDPAAAAAAIWPGSVEAAQTAAEARAALELPEDSFAACDGRPSPEITKPAEPLESGDAPDAPPLKMKDTQP
jgi:hypothetical protein